MTSSPKKRILMVDDEAAIRELYKLYFDGEGFEVTTASNAIDALDVAYGMKFDLIILDIGLGDTNGLDLIEPILSAQPETPIFVFTGLGVDNATREEALRRGACRYFNKTYPLNYLVGEIKLKLNIQEHTHRAVNRMFRD